MEAIAPLVQALVDGANSAIALVATSAIACLAHLIKRVSFQDASFLKDITDVVLPLLVERLADPKEKIRESAGNSCLELRKHNPIDVDRGLKEYGIQSRNYKIREASIRLLQTVRSSQPNFAIRSFIPFVLKALDDTNESVREAAKLTMVDLLQNSPGHAKADLKKDLQRSRIREDITAYILDQLGLADFRDTAPNIQPADEIKASYKGSLTVTGGSIAGSVATSVLQSVAGSELESMDPISFYSAKDVEHEMLSILPAFEGKESEQNWSAREKSINRLRGILRGNSFADHETTFLAHLKMLSVGISKAVNFK